MRAAGNGLGAERRKADQRAERRKADQRAARRAADQPQQAAAKAKPYTPPKTAWGEPDLRGMWPLNHLISTPFQRPEPYGDRRFLTDQEFAAAQKSAQSRNQRFQSGAIPQADAGEATRLTSLLVDPPNGRFPALTPRGKELYDQMRGSYKPGQTVFDTPDDFDSWDRCITRGMPVSMLPRNYNNGIQIMQFPGYVVHHPRDGARGPGDPDEWAPGAGWRHPAVSWASRAAVGRAIRWSSRRRTSTAARR